MTIRRLRAFIAAGRYLNLTHASRELKITQPALSRELKLLRNDIGIVLFHRVSHGIQLTPEGSEFLRDIESLLQQLDFLFEKYKKTDLTRGEETLRLGASHGPSAGLLPSVMAQFQKLYPSVGFKLYTGTSSEIEDLLLKEKIDIAITSNVSRHPSFQSIHLRNETLCVFVPTTHPLASIDKLTLAAISRFPLIVRIRRNGDSRTEDLITTLRHIGLNSPVAMRCESLDSVKAAVRQGAGVGILHADLLSQEVKRKEFRILPLDGIPLTYPSYVLHSRTKPPSRMTQAFVTLLQASPTIDQPQRASLWKNPGRRAKISERSAGRASIP